MKFMLKAVFFIFTLFFFGFSIEAQNFYQKTDHFIITWQDTLITNEEVKQAEELAERMYKGLSEYLGASKMPKNKIILNLGGDAFVDSNIPKIPFVNSQGEIFLYRYPRSGYFGELPHELVHALRMIIGWTGDRFLEEGLAECLSSLLFPEVIGFSRYGYSTTISAGSWFMDNEDETIPLKLLKNKHSVLNLKCQAQVYSIRADFFRYLLKQYGKDVFLKFVYDANSKNYETY